MDQFINYYVGVLKKYADFNGRARRREYWSFALVSFLVSIALSIVDGMLGTAFLASIYGLAVLLPGIAVTVRRLHDIGKTGWLALVALIPFIGWLVLLYFMIQDSEPGVNQWGPNPKENPATTGLEPA